MDETAISQAFQVLAQEEMDSLKSVTAVAKANQVPQPILDVLSEYQNTLLAVIQGASDDVVNILVGEGKSFQQIRAQVQDIKGSLDDKGLERLRRARFITNHLWPVLRDRVGEEVGKLRDRMEILEKIISDGSYYRFPSQVDEVISAITLSYRIIYMELHNARRNAYQEAVDFVTGLPDWSSLANDLLAENLEEREEEDAKHLMNELLKELIEPLSSRICSDENTFSFTSTETCNICNASIPLIEADIVAVSARRDQIIQQIQMMRSPNEKIERIRVADIMGAYQTLGTREEVDIAIEQLREHLLKLIDSGVKVILE